MFFGHLVDRLDFEFSVIILVAHETPNGPHAKGLDVSTKLGTISSFCANVGLLLSFQHRVYEIPLFC
jgi:hypothetical protein